MQAGNLPCWIWHVFSRCRPIHKGRRPFSNAEKINTETLGFPAIFLNFPGNSDNDGTVSKTEA